MSQHPDSTSQCHRCGTHTEPSHGIQRLVDDTPFIDYACGCGHIWSLIGETNE